MVRAGPKRVARRGGDRLDERAAHRRKHGSPVRVACRGARGLPVRAARRFAPGRYEAQEKMGMHYASEM